MNTPRQRAITSLIILIIGLCCIGGSLLFSLVCGASKCS